MDMDIVQSADTITGNVVFGWVEITIPEDILKSYTEKWNIG